MRTEFKRFRLIMLGLFILASFCLTLFQYDGLGEIHFLSRALTFDNFAGMEREDVVIDPLDPSKEVISVSSLNLVHPGVSPLPSPFVNLFRFFYAEDNIFNLRC